MCRHGVAAAALVLVTLCPAYLGPAHAQPPSEPWNAAVFVRPAGNSVPLPVRVAEKRQQAAAPVTQAGPPPLPVRKAAAGQPTNAPAGKAANAPAGEADMSKSAAPKPKPQVWSPSQIAEAKARCVKLLKGIDAVVVPQLPIRDGRCGAAAPIRIVKLGKVEFSPPALTNCDMAVALSTWIKKDLQPLAVRHLGARIAKVEVMSDYSCRNVAGRKRLSEHAFADALDIRGFVTERGKTARVLDSWGKTQREIAEEAEAAKANKQVNALEARKLTAALPPPRKRSDTLRVAADKLNGPAAPAPDKKKDAQSKYAALGPQPAPGPQPQVTPAKPKLDRTARFLRAAHAAGCRIFGTTLGPEANAAHRNHFHVDMAERKWKKICD